MSGRPNNAGIYNYDNLNAQNLYIKGKRFEDYITELVFEDQFEQAELDELRLLLQYLNTSGLSSEWIVDNNNKNQDLKTLITAIQTKLANIDSTALTQSSVLTDDNRNSVLKTRIDGNDGSISTISDKVRFINQSSVGSNSADPKTANTFSLNVNTNPTGIHKGDLRMEAGFNLIHMKNNSQTLQDLNYNDNKMDIFSPNGMITTYAHLNRIQAQNKIEIGDIGINNSGEINIGGKAAQVNIGSKDTPDALPANNTIIKIGTRGTFRNTETYLQGNIYTDEARLEDLDVTDVVSGWNVAAWASGFVLTGIPYWIAFIILPGSPSYRYADIVKMANNYLTGGLTKNHSIETSNDLAIKNLSVVNLDVVSISTPFDGLLNRRIFQAFGVHGSHSMGIIRGGIDLYVGDGELNLRNDGGIFDYVFKNAGNANGLSLKNLDVELIQCNGSSNDGKLTLGACNGNIDLITGSNGIRANATKVMEIKSNKQVLIGNNSAMVDNTYKVLVDATSHTNGIKVAKNGDALLLNPTNVSSKSLTLQDTYIGTTTKTLYTNANSDLMWDGQPVAVGSIAASGGGLTYVISAPSSTTITTPNFTPTSLTMSSTYTTATLKTATLSAYNVNTNYQIVSILGAIPKAANPILSGTYELNQFVNYSANVSGSLYAKLYFTGLPLNNVLINKTYTSPAGSGNTLNLTTPEIKVPANDVSITISNVTFPSVSIGGPDFTFTILTLTLVDNQNNILHTFLTQSGSTNTTFDRVFTRPEGPITITDTTNITGLRFNLQSSNANCVLNQTAAQDAINARYILEGSIRMLLYDGTTNPSTLTPNAVALYPLSIPLPTAPFVITDYQNPNITLEQWFIQPTGSTTNHSVSLRFNDGALSHLHTSIASISATPTLSTVMTAGNSVGNTDLNMNGQDITNADVITANTITPTAITGWNVKSLTAGSGITATNNGSGTWTITNTGIPVTPTIAQVLTAGSAAGNQNLTGINTLTATTITGWNVKQITGGTDIVVSSDQYGNYVISYDPMSQQYEASSDDYTITAAATNTARKPSWYGNTWSNDPTMTIANTCADIFMSSNGKIIAVVQRDSGDAVVRPIIYSNNFSLFYNTGNTSKNWVSIAGTTTGDAIWAIQGRFAPNTSPYAREIWRSTDQGATWTQRPSPPDFTNADPRRIRVSADGKFQLISDPRTGSLGKIYKSSDYGNTWVSQNLTSLRSTAFALAISATGQVQYVEVSGTSEGLHANNNNGGVYRSTNYGANWAYVLSTDAVAYINCDATGRIVALTTGFEVMTSRDYGMTWKTITMAGAVAVSVSPNGNIIWVGCINQTSTTQLYYSDDYGLSFTVRNQVPGSSYVSTSYTSIATNNDGTIVAGGGAGYFNVCRQFLNEVVDLTQGTGISISSVSQGTYTIALLRSPASTFFTEITVTPNTNLAFPTTMDLFKYDYEMDFTFNDVLNSKWFFLRFNQDVGLVAWTETLLYNPNGTSGTPAVAVYNSNQIGGQYSYWLNAGSVSSGTMTVKSTYRISAISAEQFVVYLMSSQPAVLPSANSVSDIYLVYATKIFYRYSTNNVSRWSPSHMTIHCGGSDFSNGRCLMRQVTKSSSYL
jgi:hypothetical protein